MQTFFGILISLALACACAHYAKLRGRNPTVWLVAGAFFGLFALITLFLLKKVNVPQPLAATGPALKAAPAMALLSPSHAEKYWYFLDAQKTQFGPMSFNALGRALLEGKVTEQTFVWNEEMENWQHLKELIHPQK